MKAMAYQRTHFQRKGWSKSLAKPYVRNSALRIACLFLGVIHPYLGWAPRDGEGSAQSTMLIGRRIGTRAWGGVDDGHF